MFSKLQMIMFFTLPAVRGAASFLRNKDSNSTGKDDLAADALDYAVEMVESLVNNTPTPNLPASLRPKPKTDELPTEKE